jgi:hypothetical protein
MKETALTVLGLVCVVGFFVAAFEVATGPSWSWRGVFLALAVGCVLISYFIFRPKFPR